MKIRCQLIGKALLDTGMFLESKALKKAAKTLPKDVILMPKRKKIGKVLKAHFDEKSQSLVCTMKITDKEFKKSLKEENVVCVSGLSVGG